MRHHDQPTTIAILGADTVVGQALCALLEGSGYDTIPLDAYPTGVVDELLDGADLLLLAPRLEASARETFLGAMGKTAPQTADLPVIALSTVPEEGSPEKEGVVRVCPGRARRRPSENGSWPSWRERAPRAPWQSEPEDRVNGSMLLS